MPSTIFRYPDKVEALKKELTLNDNVSWKYVTSDPTANANDCAQGSIIVYQNKLYRKQDNGSSTNVKEIVANDDTPTFGDVNITGLSTNLLGANESVETQVEALDEIHQSSKEPTGFVNRTDSTLSYDVNTRTLTVSGIFTFYNQGKRFVKTAVTETATHTDNIGQFYFYYDNTGTLTVGAVNVPFDLSTQTPVEIIYYNNTAATTLWAGKQAIGFEERHGTAMDWATHKDLHMNIGTYVVGSGFALSGTYSVATGTGGLVANSYGVDAGIIADEDISVSIAALSDNAGVGNQYPIFYRSGASTEWRWYVNNLPYLSDGTDITYNQFTGGAWQQTAITAVDNYTNYYLCAVPVHSDYAAYRFIWIQGQAVYASLATAQAEAIGSLTLTDLPFAEVAPLWQITMRRNVAYDDAGFNARIAATTRIIGSKLSITLTSSPTIHNNLAGRGDTNSHPLAAINGSIANAVTFVNSGVTGLSEDADLTFNASTNTLSSTNIQTQSQGTVALYDNDNSNFVKHRAGTISADTTYDWPAAPTSDSVLQSTSAGALSWVDSLNTLLPAGLLLPYTGTVAPSGWLLAYGQTVSRATYARLFAAIGETYGAGDGSTTFVLPDARGRSIFGKDNMGGSAASRVTSAGSSIDGATLGASGGAQNVTLTGAQSGLVSHNHTQDAHTHTQNAHTHTQDAHRHNSPNGKYFGLWQTGTTGSTAGSSEIPIADSTEYTNYTTATNQNTTAVNQNTTATNQAVASADASSAHTNMPPTLVLNYIIKI